MYTEQKNNKKLKALYEQSLHIKSAIPHPLIMGVIRGTHVPVYMYIYTHMYMYEYVHIPSSWESSEVHMTDVPVCTFVYMYEYVYMFNVQVYCRHSLLVT